MEESVADRQSEPRCQDILCATDIHVDATVNNEKRLVLAWVLMRNGGLSGLVTDHLRDQLAGLENCLANAFVDRKFLERV